MSVYIGCGGSVIEGLEHMLTSRILRKGKVVGRFDVSAEKLDQLNQELELLFKSLGGESSSASEVLIKEIIKKQEGIY